MSDLIYIKCYFCQKNAKRKDLIDMVTNAVLVNDEKIDFKSLVFDTCSVQIDETGSNFVCIDCNNSLVLFHMFKRDVKKYSDFKKYIEKLRILAKLEHFLGMHEDVTQLSIVEDSSKWIITKNIEEQEMEEIIEYDSECDQTIEEVEVEDEEASQELSQESITWMQEEMKTCETKRGRKIVFKCSVCDISLSSSDTFLKHLRDIHVLPEQKYTREMTREQIEWFEASMVSCKVDGSQWKCNQCDDMKFYHSEISFKLHYRAVHIRKLQEVLPPCHESLSAGRRKLNTLNDLEHEQIMWIREQASKSEVVKGRKTLYKCSVCLVVLSTQASLLRHLRDIHILKDANDEKSILKRELQCSKITVDTSNGKEILWKCSSCEQDRVYKTMQAFKLHFRMTHIRSAKIDMSLIASCKTTVIKGGEEKEAWMCPECQRFFLHREGLRNHLKSVHPSNQALALNAFKLPHAEKFPKLSDRLENKSLGKGDNFCSECGVKFLTTRHHVRPKIHRECHETFKALAPVMPHYKCERCRMVFNSQTSLSHHISLHDSSENLQQIPTEGLITFGATFFKEAVGDADDTCLDEALWECGHCSVRYFDENDCVAHQLLLHSTSIFCCIDQLEFVGITGLSKFTRHMKNKHPELFPNINYPCGNCKREFSTIYDKLSHQKLCEAKKFECDYCGRRYSNKYQLQAHVLFELGISGYPCKSCGKRCKTMSDLRIHYHTHTNMRPYQCSVCEKSFKTPAARSSHMERHTNGSGITCEICDTRLASRTLYQRHQRFQHNQKFRESQYEKNFCSHCNKSFLRTGHFKQHMKLQHGVT